MSKSTMKLGNAPNVPINEILNLRGKVCVVEFETRELLGFGDSWDAALEMVRRNGHSSKQYYRYVVPRSFRHEGEIIQIANENLPAR